MTDKEAFRNTNEPSSFLILDSLSIMTSGGNAPLRVAVVGAGLGGLAVSAALRQQGHVVEIFEASDTNAETGLGITVPPNGAKALQCLGYQRDNIHPIEWKQAKFVLPGIEGIDLFDMQYYPSIFGNYWDVCSRYALHSELKRLALSEEQDYPPCILHLSSSVISCNPEQGTIILKDGQTLPFDLVVGADGIKSRIRHAINSSLPAPPETGMCAFRFVLEKHLLGNLPGTEWMMDEGLAGPIAFLPKDHSGHIFVYAIKCPERGDILNVTVVCKDRRDQSISKWRTDISREAMLVSLSHLDDKWQQFLGLAPSIVSLWQLRALEPIPTWSEGRACILGDAAHAMFQVLGQGAAQAFEDALVLKTLIPFGTLKSEIPEILKRYEMIRKPRVHSVQNLSTEQMVSSMKKHPYMKSLELQLPVMGYDIAAEMSQYRIFSGLRNTKVEELK